ncbi:MAG: hypothetical protein P4L73_01290 [Caulobacteraceae bacterium]|nr:hypothetical protein [Caulobacteraceae bacterium]
MAVFGDNSYSGRAAPFLWSPDRNWIAVEVGRGLPRSGETQSELRIYNLSQLRLWLAKPAAQAPVVWRVTLTATTGGPVIQALRWTADSTGLAFLAKTSPDHLQLDYADLKARRIVRLSAAGQDVTAFDIADRKHYVWTVRDLSKASRAQRSTDRVETVTGRSLEDLVFPVEAYPAMAHRIDRSVLWSSNGKRGAPVLDPSGMPIILFEEGQSSLRLSPDGRRVVTARAMADVPVDWRSQFSHNGEAAPLATSSGPQRLNGEKGFNLVSQYVVLDIARRAATALDAPTGRSAGWWPDLDPVWASDGQSVLLPSAFPAAAPSTAPLAAACVGVYQIAVNALRCVRAIDASPQGPPGPVRIGFGDPAGSSIFLSYARDGGREETSRFVQTPHGEWVAVGLEGNETQALSFSVRQDANSPPVLVARGSGAENEKVVWDPNPQLRNVRRVDVSAFRWTDAAGRPWVGGIFKPPGFSPAGHYPLVIEAHNYLPNEFRPSGAFPTAYAAQQLAGDGMVVLEARCAVAADTPEEAACQVQGYDAAIKRLADEGTIDPSRIGIIGFSRTCYYVLEELTHSRYALGAASITDGLNAGYWQYVMTVDEGNDAIAREDAVLDGGPPFGDHLRGWLDKAPTFKMDHVATPLQIVGEGLPSVMGMWEPYALLRYQGKPVDMVLLHTREHVLTEPAVRMASEALTVDWMRFWLQGHEDQAPAKKTQYSRWESMCDAQSKLSAAAPLYCVRTNGADHSTEQSVTARQ